MVLSGTHHCNILSQRHEVAPGDLVMDGILCSNKNASGRCAPIGQQVECNLRSLPRQVYSSFLVLNPIRTAIPVRRSKDPRLETCCGRQVLQFKEQGGRGFKKNV